MSKVWYNGKAHDTANAKAAKWQRPKPAPPSPWGTCADCGAVVMNGQTVWWLRADRLVCYPGCAAAHPGEGHLDCAGLVLAGFDDIA